MKINTKIMVRLALFAAISIVLGKFLQIPIGESIRISFENLSLIFAGYLYGPVAGILCAVVADLLGCLLKAYTVNPIITLGAAVIGLLAGLFGKKGVLKTPNLALAVATAHISGSMIIKSIGLHIYYATPWVGLLPRIPIYLVVGITEYMLIRVCLSHKGFKELL